MDASGQSVPTGPDEQRLGPRRLLGLTRPALRLVWSASPRETVVLAALQTLSGLMLPLQLLAGKWALDEVLAAGDEDAGMSAALPAIAVALLAMTIGQLLWGLRAVPAVGPGEHRLR